MALFPDLRQLFPTHSIYSRLPGSVVVMLQLVVDTILYAHTIQPIAAPLFQPPRGLDTVSSNN